MNNLRKHGKSPYKVVVIHGGPGAAGGMVQLAKELSAGIGVLEPFQTKHSISEQVEELHAQIGANCSMPVILVGHSWGAWLAYILAAHYPEMVEKLILIGAGAFDESYNSDLRAVRLSHLTSAEMAEVEELQKQLDNPLAKASHAAMFQRFGQLMTKADSFDCLPDKEEELDFQPEIFHSVWDEAVVLRKSGELLKLGVNIQCPVVAIHGDYDPHPAAGVEEPLSRVITNFRFVCLKKCGHYPWKERQARAEFYRILDEEIVK